MDYAIDVLVTSWLVLPLLSAGAAEWLDSLRRRVARAAPAPFEHLAWARERRSMLSEARRPSEREFHRARLEVCRSHTVVVPSSYRRHTVVIPSSYRSSTVVVP